MYTKILTIKKIKYKSISSCCKKVIPNYLIILYIFIKIWYVKIYKYILKKIFFDKKLILFSFLLHFHTKTD